MLLVVKNLPASGEIQEITVPILKVEEWMEEEGKPTSIFAWKIVDSGALGAGELSGAIESDTTEQSTYYSWPW